MNNKVIGVVFFVMISILGVTGYLITHTNIKAGYVGYVYDRTLRPDNPKVIQGTSVIDKAETGRIFVNPWTQEVLKYPTTIVARSWTRSSENDNKGEDWSVITSSIEGKDIVADIYISVRPQNIGQIIGSFGMKHFDTIVNDDIYGLARGKLSIVTQKYSIYDVQAKKSEIQTQTFQILAKDLAEIYGVDLVRYEIGALTPPADIQAKIDQKTEAINAVQLAKLDRQKQDEVNQKIVDEQKAESEKEMLKRKNQADAAAYELTRKAEAGKQAAELDLAVAKLHKQAEQEKQQTYTEAYLKNKELELQYAAIDKLKSHLSIVIDSGDGSGISQIPVLNRIIQSMK